ncbi:hypothetical protein N7335_02060 [Stutzerimonas stutzeri]|uniref:Uncharacterized protein n=1 Tax=Stutzerimonas stutzeri TaxID=316 RepID=A0AA42H8L5_STUST|nr:hypothetical protein [Stutzerimonas stutzeri]MDH0145171.1 hypothetical protein [Stutzerimonas stutzeri]MDH0149574.1 hypothetical protein [Stutzerimonas stutzeri]
MKLHELRDSLEDGDELDAGGASDEESLRFMSSELTARGQIERYASSWGHVVTLARPLEFIIVNGPDAEHDGFADMLARLSRNGGLW